MLKRAIFVEYILTYSMNMNDGFNLASGNWNDKIEPIQKELEVQITCDTVLWMENLLVFLDRKGQIWSTVETLESKGSKTRKTRRLFVNSSWTNFSLACPVRFVNILKPEQLLGRFAAALSTSTATTSAGCIQIAILQIKTFAKLTDFNNLDRAPLGAKAVRQLCAA